VSDGARATFYLCGGGTTMTLTRWFTGTVAADGTLDLSNAKDDWKVTGNLETGSGQVVRSCRRGSCVIGSALQRLPHPLVLPLYAFIKSSP